MATLQTKNKVTTDWPFLRVTSHPTHTYIVRRILSGRILAQGMPLLGPKGQRCTESVEGTVALRPWLISICVDGEHPAWQGLSNHGAPLINSGAPSSDSLIMSFYSRQWGNRGGEAQLVKVRAGWNEVGDQRKGTVEASGVREERAASMNLLSGGRRK